MYRAWDGNGTGLYNMLAQVGSSIRMGGQTCASMLSGPIRAIPGPVPS